MEASLIKSLRRRLLAWYRKHRRDLPWRAASAAEANPYHVFVSEAMLQQTQVATVIDYFKRFITAFPTVEALAGADEQQVLTLWQGLGYYRRARNLRAAAKAIIASHGGAVPRDVDALLTLPGVGRYTAGAVASIAFDQPAPILDGNVARVLSRWFAIEEPIDSPAVRDRLWNLATALIAPASPGDFNQGMMELGALVCTPRQPKCLACPVAAHCEALKRQIQHELPQKNGRAQPRSVSHHVVAVEHGGRFLFEQRPDSGLWSSMWQMPTAESLDESAGAKEIRQWLRDERGVTVAMTPTLVEQFRHQTTHRTINFIVWRAAARLKGDKRHAWRSLDDLKDLPLSNPQRRAVSCIERAMLGT